MSGKISQIKLQLPKNKISIKNLCKKNNWNYEKIIEKTGIKNVYHSTNNESALNLAVKAGAKITRKNKNIDVLIYVTQSPEYHLPTNACIIQNKLGLKKNIISFDINQGCSGFIYGLFTAQQLLLKKSINKVLLICSDTYTKNIKSINKSCLTIFSDGATATLIKKNNKKSSEYIFYTDGSGADDLKLNFSGNQFQKNKKPELFMDGRKVLSFTMSVVPNIIIQTLKKNKITYKNLKYVIFHQASKIVIENLVRKLNIPMNKVFINYNKFGNTVSSTIPICLYELMKKNKIKKGDQILICGFGVGLSVGSTIIKI
jgi:3-oxoacyl-[acyl-carrier-protein] synthase-3